MFSVHVYNISVILIDRSLHEVTFIVFFNNGQESALPENPVYLSTFRLRWLVILFFHSIPFMLGLSLPTRLSFLEAENNWVL